MKKSETKENVLKKKGTERQVCVKNIFFFLMPKATQEIKKKGEGTTEVCSKKGSREPGELKKKSERVFKKGEGTECVLKGSRESGLKKGGGIGRTKKEKGKGC